MCLKNCLGILLSINKKLLSSQDVATTTRVQVLDEPDYISHSTNTLGKGMNPNILSPAMGK